MESGGRFSLSREWEGGGTVKLKELPFRRKPESLRRSRIRRRRLLQCSASRKILAVARMRFRLSPEWKVGGDFRFRGNGRGGGTVKLKELPFRRKPESLRRSRIRRRRLLQCSASRKILAVARMRFRLSPEWKVGGDFRLPLIPIPAKAGISLFPRQRRKLQNEDREIPAFAGMG